MKKIMLIIVIMALLSACGPTPTQDIQATIAVGMEQTRAAEPTSTFTPEPSPDFQATINAGIAATQTAQPSATPLPSPTPEPTATELQPPTATQLSEAKESYAVFLDKYKANFEATKSKLSTPVTSTLHRIEFEKNELGTSTLWIETTGASSDVGPTLMGYTIGVITGLVKTPTTADQGKPPALPGDLEFVHLVFRDEALAEQGHFLTTWAEMLDYANKRIEFTDMFKTSDWDLP